MNGWRRGIDLGECGWLFERQQCSGTGQSVEAQLTLEGEILS